ncbi:MAG TPA: alpha/beta hydrolase [Myxococcales bacterium]|nr:alpha/beta hydrolase [Myxococcales bacterium]
MRGTLYTPHTDSGCNRSVVLLLHGLSYGAWVWDFPLQPSTYSVARALAARGFPAVAVDELGYGTSDHPNGYTLSVESYGNITGQMITQLRAGSYWATTPRAFQQVALYGHSAGSEMAELAAGAFTPVDALIASGYTHFPSSGIFQNTVTQDQSQMLLYDYIYFTGSPSNRLAFMYNAPAADPAIMAQDNALANATPSGEEMSIPAQPSRDVLPLIHAPVLLVLGDHDALFPANDGLVNYASLDLAFFTGTADKSAYVVPQAGHAFMLHTSAPQTQQVVGDWLQARIQRCAVH